MERLRSREKSFYGVMRREVSESWGFRLLLFNGAESMTNVLRLFLPESVFGNVCCVISNAFQKARDENDVQVCRYLFRVSDHATSQFIAEPGIQTIQVPISRFELQSELRVSIHKCAKTI